MQKKGTAGNNFLEKGIQTKQGTYIMAILGTVMLNNYRIPEHLNEQDTVMDNHVMKAGNVDEIKRHNHDNNCMSVDGLDQM